MKIRQFSNFEKPNEWKDFMHDMDLWIMVYDALVFLARQKIVGLLALKAHVQNSQQAYETLLSEKEMRFFREIVAIKTNEYNPDKELENIKGRVVCVEINPKSELSTAVGAESICGQFLALNSGKAETRIKSDENGEYETKEAAFSFRLAYPDADHHTDISLLDMVNIESFI